MDIWPLWRNTERTLRDILQFHLQQTYGTDWVEALCRARPRLEPLIEQCRQLRNQDLKRFGARAASSLLAYTYPMQLYELMCTDWVCLGEPLLGSDKTGWRVKFAVLSKVRTPLAHNREDVVTDAERTQARGFCTEILERYQAWGTSHESHIDPGPKTE
jgi:hypothetical protein